MDVADIVRKTVAFNVADPIQRALVGHTEQFPNFSYYIKTLIQRDMDSVAQIKKAPADVTSIDESLISGLI